MRPRKYDWKKIHGEQDNDTGVYHLKKNNIETLVEYNGNGSAGSVKIELYFPEVPVIKQEYDIARDEIIGEINDIQHQFLLSHYTDVDAIKAAFLYKGAGKLPTKVRGAALGLLGKLPEALGHTNNSEQ